MKLSLCGYKLVKGIGKREATKSMFDRNFPSGNRRQKKLVIWVGEMRAGCVRKLRRVDDNPQKRAGVQQEVQDFWP